MLSLTISFVRHIQMKSHKEIRPMLLSLTKRLIPASLVLTTALLLPLQADALENRSDDWEGISAGISLSLTDINADIQYTATPGLFSHPSGYDKGIDFSLEYLRAMTPNLLIGLELMASQHSGSVNDGIHYNNFNLANAYWNIDAKRSARLLGKIALTASENTLVYLGAGIETTQFGFTETTVSQLVVKHTESVLGQVIVVGFDHKLSDDFSVRLELSQTGMKNKIYHGFQSATEIDPDSRAIKVGLRYSF